MIVHGEDKSGASTSKDKNQNKKGRQGGQGKPKGGKGSWGPSKGCGPKGHVQVVIGRSTSEIPSGTMMVVATKSGTQPKPDKNQKQNAKRKLGKHGQKPLPKCFLCGGNHNVNDCLECKAVKNAIPKKQGNA